MAATHVTDLGPKVNIGFSFRGFDKFVKNRQKHHTPRAHEILIPTISPRQVISRKFFHTFSNLFPVFWLPEQSNIGNRYSTPHHPIFKIASKNCHHNCRSDCCVLLLSCGKIWKDPLQSISINELFLNPFCHLSRHFPRIRIS